MDSLDNNTKVKVHSPQSSLGSTFVSGVKSVPASFEFSATSEKGINLVVDLNSSISDWFKRWEDEANIFKSLQKQNFRSFCQEIQNLGNKQLSSEDVITFEAEEGMSQNDKPMVLHDVTLVNDATVGNDIIYCCSNVNGIHLKGRDYTDALFKGLEFASNGKQRRKRSIDESDKDYSCNSRRDLRSANRLQNFPRRSTRLSSKK
ncbi:hypothetical protein DM860_005752 [Cuscuta australis]|uniref:Uncharacterized protein n=1 Tax=Cuscuta australis TaxID=267555 RepID=A0A328DUV5_9ASTE|nr:hypothetical protein DM860_005752 [Cuscuta australis]